MALFWPVCIQVKRIMQTLVTWHQSWQFLGAALLQAILVSRAPFNEVQCSFQIVQNTNKLLRPIPNTLKKALPFGGALWDVEPASPSER